MDEAKKIPVACGLKQTAGKHRAAGCRAKNSPRALVRAASVCVMIIICAACFNASASSPDRMVREGNRLYKEKKYDEALKLYDQALLKQPDSAVISFNAGAAQYKTGEYKKAAGSFERVFTTQDKVLEAKANYNLGNSRYMLGLSEEHADLSGAIKLLEGALSNYRRAIELVPEDEDAKVNYRIVESKLNELREKLKNQPQPQERKKEGQREREKEEQGGQAEEQHGQGEQEKQEQKQSAAQPQDGPQEPGSASEGMSEKEAMMLIEGHRQQEASAGMLKDDRHRTEELVLKDW